MLFNCVDGTYRAIPSLWAADDYGGGGGIHTYRTNNTVLYNCSNNSRPTYFRADVRLILQVLYHIMLNEETNFDKSQLQGPEL